MSRKTQAKQQAILEMATEVFREFGFERASIAEICARLGSSKRTIYNYFASKEELFFAVITVHKVLPMGGGIGGGSSDAATTLIALNRLWGCGLSRAQLQALGLQLGADVPVFVFGRDAFAEGVGEALQPLELPPAWYVVISPGVQVPTAEIFSAGDLTRNSPPIIMPDFAASTTRNDLQPVACSRYPEVLRAIEWLDVHAPARMTGSGACVFAEVSSEDEAERITKDCPPPWKAWKARSTARHPLYEWLQ